MTFTVVLIVFLVAVLILLALALVVAIGFLMAAFEGLLSLFLPGWARKHKK
jgi:hypothetical protein